MDDINQFPTPGAFLLPQESLSVLQQMLIDRLIEEICALRQRHPQLNLRFVGVSFGAVITHQGIVQNASILWHHPASGFDIAEELRSRLPNTEIWVVNDVSAMAWRYQQHSRFVLFTVSTGVASKVFNQALNTKEKLELDDRALGGEVGHVVVAPERVQAALNRSRRMSVSIRTRDGRHLTFVGSRGSHYEDYISARDLVTSGHLDLSQLVTQIISFPALPRVLSEMCDCGTVEGKFAMRVVVDMALFGDVIHQAHLLGALWRATSILKNIF